MLPDFDRCSVGSRMDLCNMAVLVNELRFVAGQILEAQPAAWASRVS